MREHGLLLYLDPQEVLALAKLQTEHELGRSFAGKKALNEGFHRLGVLSDEYYQISKTKYSVKITEKNKKPPTLKQIRAKKELEELEKYYSRALENWSLMKEKAKQYYLTRAKKDANKVKNANLILALENTLNSEAVQ